MSEWWTYSLNDFLLFSPATYARLFARYNHAVWPAQLAALAAGAALLALGARRHPVFPRAALAALALGWAWTGWAFHLQRYATINWAAVWFAAGFLVQAALLGVAAIRFGNAAPARGARFSVGIGMLALALLYPLLTLLTGRPFDQGEVIGFAPDPTALATLGLLLMARLPWRRLLLPLPLLWCAISGATLWAMAAAQSTGIPGGLAPP